MAGGGSERGDGGSGMLKPSGRVGRSSGEREGDRSGELMTVGTVDAGELMSTGVV